MEVPPAVANVNDFNADNIVYIRLYNELSRTSCPDSIGDPVIKTETTVMLPDLIVILMLSRAHHLYHQKSTSVIYLRYIFSGQELYGSWPPKCNTIYIET